MFKIFALLYSRCLRLFDDTKTFQCMFFVGYRCHNATCFWDFILFFFFVCFLRYLKHNNRGHFD